MPKQDKNTPVPLYRKKAFLWTVGSAVVLLLALLLAFRLSPWPGALVIRTAFNNGDRKSLAKMEAALPDYPVTVQRDRQYRAGDNDAFLDVYMPKDAGKQHKRLPIVVWTHGGAWVSGDKDNVAPYYERLASEGFVVVAVNYTLAPNKPYPYAVRQLNDAHRYIVNNAGSFAGDPHKIILAGDSAGAQLSSQLAAIVTNPGYAREVGVRPALEPSDLAAVVLFCGIYKMEGLVHPDPTLPKIVGWGDDVAVWAYSGSRDKNTPLLKQMSAYYHVSSQYPATFISGGNGDPLTDAQSKPLAAKLTGMDVPVTTLFFEEDHQPRLPHEYQFTFNRDGNTAFARMVQFLKDQH